MRHRLIRIFLGVAASTSLLSLLFVSTSLRIESTDSHVAQTPSNLKRLLIEGRSQRFPSVDQRVRLYMTTWYNPACHDRVHYRVNGTNLQITEVDRSKRRDEQRNLTVSPVVLPNILMYLTVPGVLECGDGDVYERNGHHSYCRELIGQTTLLGTVPPPLMQLGDLNATENYGEVQLPFFRKFRLVHSTISTTQFYHEGKPCWPITEPIIWKMDINRHFGPTAEVPKYDRSWQQKKNMAVFRGTLTGNLRVEDVWSDRMSDLEKCFTMIRCRLVYEHGNSTLLDAKAMDTLGNIPDVINGVQMVAPFMSMGEQLAYKAIVMLEGNDVSSGLKWALCSNSVVLMQPPFFTSWAMEELLEPWVHYVPLNEDLSNVEERIQWVIDHDDEAHAISRRATLWIYDLLFHPDAAQDEARIQLEILRRYQSHFVLDPMT